MSFRSQASASGVSEPCVRSRIADNPNSSFRVPWPSLLRSWRSSLSRTIAMELCNLPRRIAAILHASHLRFGPQIPVNMLGHIPGSLASVSSFALACNEDIQQLRALYPWSGPLDLQVAAEAYRRGALWASRS